MIYAPVIIPTLNRYDHLKRLIDSLIGNSYAKETELYISLDYPPSEKYTEGYKRTEQYLDSSDKWGFKGVHIYKQEHNLGPSDNIDFLKEKVFEKYDRFIYTEDDNEFSPNFLEYIDKGLEIFKEDSEVFAIAAGIEDFEEFNFGDGENVIKFNVFQARGYGMWKDRCEAQKDWINYENMLMVAKNRDLCRRLYNNAPLAYTELFNVLLANPSEKSIYIRDDGRVREFDYTRSIYMAVYDMYVVIPKKCKVRNWGYDGSGINCEVRADYDPSSRMIDASETFDFLYKEPLEMNPANMQVYGREYEWEKKAAVKYEFIIRNLGGVSIAKWLHSYFKKIKKR